MNRQTLQAKESAPAKKKSSFSWLRPAAAHPAAEHEAPSASSPAFAHDFTKVPVRPMQLPGVPGFSCPFAPQRCPSGGACHACPPKMQAKLKIGQPGDQYEQEADRVAETVMRMPEPQVQRKCSAPGCKDEDEDKILQGKSAGSAGNAQVAHPLIQNVLSSPGQPLDAGTRSFMEPRFGQDFSGVRVHVGGQAAESARAVNARAYTVGRDVVFGEGQYVPGSDEGRRLVAHELVHVHQQTGKIQLRADSAQIGTASRFERQPVAAENQEQVEQIVNQIFTVLQNDPDDQSGQINFLLDGVNLSTRHAIFYNLKNQLTLEQQRQLQVILARDTQNHFETEGEYRVERPEENGDQPDHDVRHQEDGGTAKLSYKQQDVLNEDRDNISSNTHENIKVSSNLEGYDQPSSGGNEGGVEAESSFDENKATFASENKEVNSSDKNIGVQPSPYSETKSVQNDNTANSQTGERGASQYEIGATTPSFERSEIVVPSAKLENTQHLLDQVSDAANAARQRFTDRLAQGTEAISTSVRQQQAALSAADEQQSRAIQTVFAGARTQVNELIAGNQNQLQTDAASHLTSLEEGHVTAIGEAETAFASGQERVQNLGDTYAEQSLQVAEQSAQQVHTRIQGIADEARTIGEQKARAGGSTPELAQAKARAATEIASDTASKITSGVSDAMGDIQATGPETARGFREQGQEAARQVGAGQAEVVNQLTVTNQQAAAGIQQAVAQGSQSLGSLGAQITTQLSSLEQTLQNQLQTQVTQKDQEIYQAGQQAIAGFQQQGQQAADAGDEQLTQFNQQVAGIDVEPALAGEVSGEVAGQVNRAYDNLIATADGAFQQTDSTLTQAGTAVIDAINGIADNASSQVQTFLGQAQGQVVQQVSAISGQLGTSVTQANTAGSSMVSQVATSLQGQLGQIDSGFGQGLEQYRGGLNQQVTAAETQAREPRQDLSERINTAQRRAEERSKQGFWERQWNDFVEMISDPGFLAGLIAGLLLTVLVIFWVGTGGLGFLATVAVAAVIGAIAAGVGTLVSQLTAGSYSNLFSGDVSWSRVNGQQILINMAVGALVGAGLAAAELWGASVITLSLTAGVITIVTNGLTVGWKNWDKNLIANMLLVGLFAKLMRTKTARGLVERIAKAGSRNRGGRGSSNRSSGEEPEPVRPTPVIKPGDKIVVNDASRLSYTEPVFDGRTYWQWNLIDTETGAIFTQYVKATATSGPDMYLTPRTAYIEGVGQVELVAEGFKWTTEANRLNMEAYMTIFGERPPNLNGQIWASNLDRFVVSYDKVRALNTGLSRQAIADNAIRSTSFGQGKIEQGYGNLRVVMDDVRFKNVTIDGQTYYDVPSNKVAIDVIAEPTAP